MAGMMQLRYNAYLIVLMLMSLGKLALIPVLYGELATIPLESIP